MAKIAISRMTAKESPQTDEENNRAQQKKHIEIDEAAGRCTKSNLHAMCH